MAEEKKDVKKEVKKDDKKPSGGVVWEEVILLILGIIALLFVFVPRFFTQKNVVSSGENINSSFDLGKTINNLITGKSDIIIDNNVQTVDTAKAPNFITEEKSRLTDFFKNLTIVVFSILIFLSLLFSAIIYYNKFRRQLIIAVYKKKLEPEVKGLDEKNEAILEKLEPDNNGIVNVRWQTVGRYYNSANQSDWKLAIIEADIMLYDVLNKSGFKGDSIGEMLKNTDKSKLETLDLAWSAHKIRNEIAHQGLDYVLSRSKVEEAISKYEKVFDELNFI